MIPIFVEVYYTVNNRAFPGISIKINEACFDDVLLRESTEGDFFMPPAWVKIFSEKKTLISCTEKIAALHLH